jgi:hypothetical protein
MLTLQVDILAVRSIYSHRLRITLLRDPEPEMTLQWVDLVEPLASRLAECAKPLSSCSLGRE